MTLLSIYNQVVKQNQQKMAVYQQGIQDWSYNAQWAFYAHQPVPQAPPPPQIATMWVVFADVNGKEVPLPEGGDGLHYAWTWETYETFSINSVAGSPIKRLT